MRTEQRAVPFVVDQAGRAEQGKRFVARAFGGQEVAVMGAAVCIDEFDPAPSEPLERVDLRRIDDVLDNASDQLGHLVARFLGPALTADAVGVRDSKNGQGGQVTVDRRQWKNFLSRITDAN